MVDVQNLSHTTRGRGAPFSCLGCEQELIPKLGEYRAKHFAHKPPEVCSAETYLHQLGKLVFFTSFKSCLESGRPFKLVRDISATCNHYEEQLGLTCPVIIEDSYDLTRYFDQVALEADYGGFRADILLSSSSNDEVLFVEVAVTHTCEPGKLASGLRIIEFDVDSEESAFSLGRETIEQASHTKFYNFKQVGRTSSFCEGRCEGSALAFFVYPSRKSILINTTPEELLTKFWKRRALHKEVIGRGLGIDRASMFKQKVREVHFAGVPVENCFMCRYHGADGFENAVYCKLRKEAVGSNEAVECGHYKPVSSIAECEKIDRRNDEYMHRNIGWMVRRQQSRR